MVCTFVPQVVHGSAQNCVLEPHNHIPTIAHTHGRPIYAHVGPQNEQRSMSLNCVSDCLSTLRFSKGHIFVSQPSFIDREGFCSWCQVIGGDARNGYLDEAWNFLRWLGSETHSQGLKLDACVFFSVFRRPEVDSGD